jgi:hypothetical protein
MLTEIPLYSLPKILWVWAAAAVPMAILGWFVAPALALGSDDPVFARLAVLTVGLLWQFALIGRPAHSDGRCSEGVSGSTLPVLPEPESGVPASGGGWFRSHS